MRKDSLRFLDSIIKPLTILFVVLIAFGGVYGMFAQASAPHILISRASAQGIFPAPRAVKIEADAQVVAQPGEVVTEPTVTPVSTDDWFSFVLQSMGGLKGARALAIALALTKILIMFMGTPLFGSLAGFVFHGFTGGTKLTIVLGLNVVASVLALMASGGVTLGAALIHSSTIAMVSVFINQVYKQYFQKDANSVG